MVAQQDRLLTPEEYLAFERASEVKHEYVAGELFAMTGATRKHNLIAGNTLSGIRPQLRGRRCEIYPSDMRVKVEALGIYTYPDLSVVCGPPRFEANREDSLLNPVLLIEVLSPSTERYDREMKFRRYQLIPSFAEYLLIAQDRPRIEHYLRQDDGSWTQTITEGLAATLTLPTIVCTLPLALVYEEIAWNATERGGE